MKLSKRRRVVSVVLWIFVVCVVGLTFGSCASRFALGDWPNTSVMPVTVLEHPTVESKASELKPGVDEGYQYVAFGDQRALADGE